MERAVLIREVGPREGFQTLSRIIPTEEKIRLIDTLSETGVCEIEIASFVRADRVPQMADGEKIVAGYNRLASVRYLGLYLNHKGFERAEHTRRLDNLAWIYSAASDAFLASNNNTSAAEVLAGVPGWIELFGRYGKSLHGVMISTAFGTHAEGRFGEDRALAAAEKLINAARDAGAEVREISLADTTGVAVPDQVRRTVAAIMARFPGVAVSLHLHDTNGCGLANAYAGYLEGVRIFESSVGGLGGCPFVPGASGNIVTEDLVAMFEGQGVATGINVKKYIAAAHLAESIVGIRLAGKMMRK